MNRSTALARHWPILPLIGFLSLTGCSSFNRDWRATSAQERGTNGLAGKWEGTWRSEASGHNDELRCLITEDPTEGCRARFHARYKKLFRFTFEYTVPLQVEFESGTNRFHGEADLGWLAGGRYQYAGTATATNFNSTYECKYDHGVFQLHRLPE